MKRNSDSLVFAWIGVFFSIVGFIIVLLARKEDKYAMYYAKQGLVLFIAYVIAVLANFVLGFIPIVGTVVSVVLWIFIVVLWLIGWISALQGTKKPIPLIGELAEKIKL